MGNNAENWTPPSSDGVVTTEFKVEGDQLVKRTTQPGRSEILHDVALQRREAPRQGFLGGYKVATIPAIDIPRVTAKYPALFDREADADSRRLALIFFSHDSEFKHLVIKGA